MDMTIKRIVKPMIVKMNALVELSESIIFVALI